MTGVNADIKKAKWKCIQGAFKMDFSLIAQIMLEASL